MNKATSVFLDALRVFAAFYVFIEHSSFDWFSPHTRAFPKLAYDCVMIFFVLSGYVITFATLSKPMGAKRYFIARFARLYSVLFPAVCLTAALRVVGGKMNPGFYGAVGRGHEFLREFLSLCFVQEWWFFSASPPTNGPIWSVSYEFSYYLLFGILLFVRPLRRKLLAMLAVMILIGPKILLLFPVWIFGAVCYWVGRKVELGRPSALVGFVLNAASVIWLMKIGWRLPSTLQTNGLAYSSYYVSDAVLGIAVGLMIFFFDQAFRHARIPKGLENGIRRVADVTFSLYLFHFPIMYFCAATLDTKHLAVPQTVGVMIGILALIVLLSRVTEARKTQVRVWIVEIWNFIEKHVTPRKSLVPLEASTVEKV